MNAFSTLFEDFWKKNNDIKDKKMRKTPNLISCFSFEKNPLH